MSDQKSGQLKLAIENIRKDFFSINESMSKILDYIQFLNLNLLIKLKENLNDFNENDLKRVRENDDWIRAYNWKEKHDDGLKCLIDALKWRQKIGVNCEFLTTNY